MSADTSPKDKISVLLAPAVTTRLLRFARQHRWSRSTAAAALIERGLDAEDARNAEDAR
jgi:hypothetical protein